jgi:hypothetical protein
VNRAYVFVITATLNAWFTGTPRNSVLFAAMRAVVADAVGLVPNFTEHTTSVFNRTKRVAALKAADWTEPPPIATVCPASDPSAASKHEACA